MAEQKKERTFDEYQKKAINIDINAVVSAGAGSGKTTVLSERFLQLVQQKHFNVDEILTLTFTKKATVEMSSRIYKVLKEKAPEQAADFYKANIKTLDSYCSSVAKMGAHYYGITPDFVQDDSIITKIKEMALPFILEHRDNAAIKYLVDTKDFSEKAEEIFVNPILENSTLAEPMDFDKGIEFQMKEICEAWIKYTKKVSEIIENYRKEYADFQGNKKTGFFMKLENVIKEIKEPEIPVLTEETIRNYNPEDFKEYIDFLEKAFSVPKAGNSKVTEVLRESIEEFRDSLYGTVYSILNYAENFWVMEALLPLLKEFQEKVNLLKRTTGTLTFSDIANLATCTLRDYPEIRQIEKQKYKAIMIDEFQDNNSQQRDMLFMLAEKPERMEKGVPEVDQLMPDKLFFVGDEKQSIYRFRGADVSVFRALSDDFKQGNLSMTTNFRSTPALIAAYNTIFGGFPYPPGKDDGGFVPPCVFYTERKNCDQVPKYEAIYHQVTMSEDAKKLVASSPAEELFAPKIHFALYDTKSNENTDDDSDLLKDNDAEVEWVAEKIKELMKNGRKASDIAVLFRDYKYQPLYERTFLKHGIPYNTEVVTGFFNDGPVNDIFAFLRLTAYPNDTLPFAQLLRSPMCNLESEEVNAILSSGNKPFEGNYSSLLSKNSLARYEHLKEACKKLKEFSGKSSIAKLVSTIWYDFGYRYETMWNQTVKMYSKMYDLIFELARKADLDNMGLAAFVDNMETYQDQKSKLDNMDIPLEQTSGVHILTIHKSKGLEYPVVFICGASKQTNRDKNSEATYSSKKFGITVNTPGNSGSNYFYNLVKDENSAMQAAELRRLVYVALTRAKEEIFITSGKYSDSKDSSVYLPGNGKDPATIMKVLEPVMNYYTQEGMEGPMPFDRIDIEPAHRTNELTSSRRKNNLQAKKQLLKDIEENGHYQKAETVCTEQIEAKYLSPSKLHEASDEVEDGGKNFSVPDAPYQEINDLVNSLRNFDYNNFGSIAHAYMEALFKEQHIVLLNANDVAGLETEENEKIVENICLKMREKFLSSEIGKQACESEWKKPEYSFRGKVGNKILRGIIDLVFRNKDGTYTILDYKTNQEIDEDIYVEQLACYRRVIADMLGVEDPSTIRCVLYYLRHNKLHDISDKCSKVNLENVINSYKNIEKFADNI